jgi:hypothetical protein
MMSDLESLRMIFGKAGINFIHDSNQRKIDDPESHSIGWIIYPAGRYMYTNTYIVFDFGKEGNLRGINNAIL